MLDVNRRAATQRGASASVAALAIAGTPPAAAAAATASAASIASVCVEPSVGSDIQQAVRAEEVAASGPQGPVADILADVAFLVGPVQGRGHHGLGIQNGSRGSSRGDARVGFHVRAAAAAEVGLDVLGGFGGGGGVPPPVLRRCRRRPLSGEVHLEVLLREVTAGAQPAERQ